MFYEFSQNNSGGWFQIDENLNQYVIVEANSAEEANDIAESIGIYFHGAGDCECCGFRWSSVWHDDKGTETPQIYGEEWLVTKAGVLLQLLSITSMVVKKLTKEK